jgi:hypothetical protein
VAHKENHRFFSSLWFETKCLFRYCLKHWHWRENTGINKTNVIVNFLRQLAAFLVKTQFKTCFWLDYFKCHNIWSLISLKTKPKDWSTGMVLHM